MRFKLAARILWVMALASLTAVVHGQGLVANEASLQAAIVYNFAAFTTWPAVQEGSTASDKLVFCVMGSPDVKDALESRKNKSIKGKVMEVKTITGAAQASSCQVLFVGQDDHKRLRAISQATLSVPLLVVAEEGGFDVKDVTIALRQKDDRYTFNINQTTAKARSLVFSSQLLALAVQVY